MWSRRAGCRGFTLVELLVVMAIIGVLVALLLPDVRHDFLIAGARARSVAGHGADMLASRCYQASGGRLTCLHCHHAHRPAQFQASREYDARCAACHPAELCRRAKLASGDPSPRAASARHPAEASCIGCHMPRRATREGIHLPLTDHTIPRYGEAEPADTPTQPTPAADSIGLRSAWPGEEADAMTLGAAYVLWHETMGPRPESFARGIALLEEALRQQPEDREACFWLGSALVAYGRGGEARPYLQAALEHPFLRPLARFRLGLACELAGDRPAAIAAYERLVREAPRWIEPYDRLADLYLAENRPEQAAAILRTRIARLPEAAALATWAVAERLTGGTLEQALDRLEEALRRDPRQVRVYLARASLWLLAGHSRMAQADLERAARLQPDPPAVQAWFQAPSGRLRVSPADP